MWHEGLTADRSYSGHIIGVIGISFPDCIQQPGVPQASFKTLYQMCATEGVDEVLRLCMGSWRAAASNLPLFHSFRCGEFGKLRD